MCLDAGLKALHPKTTIQYCCVAQSLFETNHSELHTRHRRRGWLRWLREKIKYILELRTWQIEHAENVLSLDLRSLRKRQVTYDNDGGKRFQNRTFQTLLV